MTKSRLLLLLAVGALVAGCGEEAGNGTDPPWTHHQDTSLYGRWLASGVRYYNRTSRVDMTWRFDRDSLVITAVGFEVVKSGEKVDTVPVDTAFSTNRWYTDKYGHVLYAEKIFGPYIMIWGYRIWDGTFEISEEGYMDSINGTYHNSLSCHYCKRAVRQ